MKKLIIFLLILVSYISIVNATVIEKPLNISIANCYNVSIEVDLNNGKETDLQFKGCKKIDNYHFICDCFTRDNKNFSIVMQSDNYPVRDLREYDIKFKVTHINFNTKTTSFDITDAGEYYELPHDEITYLTYNKSDNYKIIEKPIYINRTIEVPIEKIVYQDREVIKTEYVNVTVPEYIYVNVTEYFENTTRIEELNNHLNRRWITIWFLFIICNFAVCFACYYLYKYRDIKYKKVR